MSCTVKSQTHPAWCLYRLVRLVQRMDRTTYKNDNKSISMEHYYAVRLNAESREKVVFNNNNMPVMNWPSSFYSTGLNFQQQFLWRPLMHKPAPLAGYLRPKEMEAPLEIFGEGAHKQLRSLNSTRAWKESGKTQIRFWVLIQQPVSSIWYLVSASLFLHHHPPAFPAIFSGSDNLSLSDGICYFASTPFRTFPGYRIEHDWYGWHWPVWSLPIVIGW